MPKVSVHELIIWHGLKKHVNDEFMDTHVGGNEPTNIGPITAHVLVSINYAESLHTL